MGLVQPRVIKQEDRLGSSNPTYNHISWETTGRLVHSGKGMATCTNYNEPVHLDKYASPMFLDHWSHKDGFYTTMRLALMVAEGRGKCTPNPEVSTEGGAPTARGIFSSDSPVGKIWI